MVLESKPKDGRTDGHGLPLLCFFHAPSTERLKLKQLVLFRFLQHMSTAKAKQHRMACHVMG